MKLILLLTVGTGLLFSGCASSHNSRETEVDIPDSHNTVVRDQIPAEGGRKIPVVQQY